MIIIDSKNNIRLDRVSSIVQKMVAAKVCDNTPEAIAEQIAEVERWTDVALDAMERVLGRHLGTKPSP